jgi:hypothetical protein
MNQWFILEIISESDQSGVVTVKTNYIYIGIAIVAGFGLLIVILILTVIHQLDSRWLGFGLCCLTPLSTIFKLYRGDQFYR